MNEDKWQNSVRVLDVPPEVVDLVELYLESPLKGGGDLEACVYDPKARHVTVVFVDPRGTPKIIFFVLFVGHSFDFFYNYLCVYRFIVIFMFFCR